MSNVYTRWLIRRDMPEVLAIDSECFADAWAEEDLVRVMGQKNVIGFVAERAETIVGFVIYEFHPDRLRIVRLAVAREYQHTGVGRGLIEMLIRKLSKQRRAKINLDVPESNLAAQLFLRAMGFKAIGTIRGRVWEGEDDYVFQYRLRTPACVEA